VGKSLAVGLLAAVCLGVSVWGAEIQYRLIPRPETRLQGLPVAASPATFVGSLGAVVPDLSLPQPAAAALPSIPPQSDARPSAIQGLSLELPDMGKLGADSARETSAADFERRIYFQGTPSGSGALNPVTDQSLQDAYGDVLRLREGVWAGSVPPGEFYGKVESLFARRFGPNYAGSLRSFLAQKSAEPLKTSGDIGFAGMSADERKSFFQAMPKGADIHVHLTATADPETMLRLAEELNVSFPTADVIRRLRDVHEDSALYGLDPSRPALTVREMSPELRKAVQKTIAINPGEDFSEFLKKWTLLFPIINARGAEYAQLKAYAEKAKAQNILYLEVMDLAVPAYKQENAVAAARRVEEETGVTIRFLAHNNWRDATADVVEGMTRADGLRKTGVTVGYNFVGDEKSFRPLGQYESARFLRDEAPELSLSVHAGEQPGTADNMVNALLLGAKRFGHATQVDENPIAMALLYAGKTPVEVSLISNRATGVMPDLSKHPLPRMLSWGVPVMLATDDPGIFRSSLSDEFETAQRTFGLSWGQLKEMSRNSIRYAFLDESTKKTLLARLEVQLSEFERSFAGSR